MLFLASGLCAFTRSTSLPKRFRSRRRCHSPKSSRGALVEDEVDQLVLGGERIGLGRIEPGTRADELDQIERLLPLAQTGQRLGLQKEHVGIAVDRISDLASLVERGRDVARDVLAHLPPGLILLGDEGEAQVAVLLELIAQGLRNDPGAVARPGEPLVHVAETVGTDLVHVEVDDEDELLGRIIVVLGGCCRWPCR